MLEPNYREVLKALESLLLAVKSNKHLNPTEDHRIYVVQDAENVLRRYNECKGKLYP